MPKLGLCTLRQKALYFGRRGKPLLHTALGIILFYSAKSCKRDGPEIRTLRVFKDNDYTFGARHQRQKTAGAWSCCIPEQLALKGLKGEGRVGKRGGGGGV